MNKTVELNNAPVKAQNDQALAQTPGETSRDSENNQAAESLETEKEAAVASSALVLPSFDSISLSQQQEAESNVSPQPIQTAPSFLESMIWGARPQKLSRWSRLVYGTRWLWRQWRCLIWLHLMNLKVTVRNYRRFGKSYSKIVSESNLVYKPSK